MKSVESVTYAAQNKREGVCLQAQALNRVCSTDRRVVADAVATFDGHLLLALMWLAGRRLAEVAATKLHAAHGVKHAGKDTSRASSDRLRKKVWQLHPRRRQRLKS
jgi:hypothetical protein